MKRIASVVLLIVLLGAIPTAALAETYTDDANRITAEIPDGEYVYYYTPAGTNMFEDLLEQVESSERDIRLLIRSYASDYLGWSLEIMASDLEEEPTSSPLPDPQVQEDALDAPSPGTPQSVAEYTNITVVPRSDQREYEELVREAYAGRFNFSEPEEGSLNGVPALQMDGTGVVDSIWGSYDASVYLLTNEYRLLTVSLVYQKSENNEYKDEARDALAGVFFGDAPPSTPEPEPSPSLEPTPEPTPTIAPTPAPTATPAPEGFFRDLWNNIQEMFSRNPNLIYYILIALAALLLLIALAVHLRNVRRRRKARDEEEDEWTQISGGVAQELEAQMEKNAPSQPRRLQGTEDGELSREEQASRARKDHDYAEDIFRYTQQPGPEVNDVSRFTHGYDDEVDDELKKLQDQSFTDAQPAKSQSVGSRVERNRRRRGK